MSVKSVAVYGGTGNIGPAIVQALTDANFNVTVLSRSVKHPDHLPSSVKIIKVDFEDASAITSALKGIDALVSAVGTGGLDKQPFVFDAAIAAGVKWILPSEFGSDTSNPKSRQLPVFGHKIETQKWLADKAAEGKVSYVLLANSAFFDWGLTANFIINTSGGTTRVFDGGDVPFSTTLLSDVGKAVAGVLKNPEAYKNKAVYVHTAVITQNRLIAAARKAGVEVKTVDDSTKDTFDKASAMLKKGENIGAAMFEYLNLAIFDPSYGPHFQNVESEKFGIKVLSDAEADAVAEKIIRESRAQS